MSPYQKNSGNVTSFSRVIENAGKVFCFPIEARRSAKIRNDSYFKSWRSAMPPAFKL